MIDSVIFMSRLHGVCTPNQRIERRWAAHSHSIDAAQIRHASGPSLETGEAGSDSSFVRRALRLTAKPRP